LTARNDGCVPMRLLLHTCCAPCVVAPIGVLREEGFDVTLFFYNPNVHPLLEFRKRLKAVYVFADQVKLPLIADEEYGLKEYLSTIWPDIHARCVKCYRMRLDRTAMAAASRGFDAFTSSLLFSTQQRYNAIVKLGNDAARKHGVEFIVRDLRGLHQQSLAEARSRSLYRQQYCGCIFSEYDRYKDTTRELYRGR